MPAEQPQYTPQQVRSLYQALLDEKQKVKTSQEALERLKTLLENSKIDGIQQLKNEKEQLLTALQESRFHSQQVEKGIDFLRAKLQEAKTDRELLKAELQTTKEELQQLNIKQDQFKELELELEAVRGQFENLKTMVKASRRAFDTLSIELKETKCSLENQDLKDQKIEDLEERVRQQVLQWDALIEKLKIQEEIKERLHLQEVDKLKNEIILLNDQRLNDQHLLNDERLKWQQEIENSHAHLEEVQMQLKIAQQHLAKKIKETSQAIDQMEVEKEEKEQSERQLNLLRTKYSEMEKLLEGWQKRQEEIKESMRLETDEKLKAHQKAFELEEKIRKLEAENGQLKKTQELYLQLKQLLNGIKEQEPSSQQFPTAPHPPPSYPTSTIPRHYHDYE